MTPTVLDKYINCTVDKLLALVTDFITNFFTIHQILKTPNQLQMKGLHPPRFIFKACVSYYFTLHQNKALKKL